MEFIGYSLGITILVAGIPFMILGLCNKWLGPWACRRMGWHLPPRSQGFDGCSFTGKCPRCGDAVLQDGQGNWF